MVKNGVLIWMMILAASALVAACASPTKHQLKTGPAYELIIEDRPELQLFLLRLRSNESKPLCINSEGWPNSRGEIWSGSAPPLIRLRSKDRLVSAVTKLDEYCPGGCQTVIPPHGVLLGDVKYETFGDPKVIRSLPERRLEVDIELVRCKRS